MNHDGVGLSIDDNPARRVSCCLFPKPVGNTLVEFQFFIVDSIGVAARSTPGQAGIRMEIEQHGHVWPAGAHCKHLERCNAFMADFADGIFSCRVGLMKPHAAIFALAERRFGIDPANTLFIDDHADNVAAARRRSWQALQFADAGQCSAEMQALGW